MRPYILAESNWRDVSHAQEESGQPFEVAVLPWGATEAHNYHLPYGTDNYQADYVAAEAARIAWEQGARVTVLPCVPFGVNTGQLDVALDLNLYPSTQMAILQDLGEAVLEANVRKLVILNGHGGNGFKQMIREVGARLPQLFIATLDWYAVVPTAGFFQDPGDHAGELETSAMQHIAPDLVKPLTEAGSGAAKTWRIPALRQGWAWAERQWTEVTEDTGVGDPAPATPEKGRAYLEAVTSRIAEFFVDLADADVDDLYEEGETKHRHR
jgi:creatinine amidohydrolase